MRAVWRQLVRGLTNLLARRRSDAELDEELAHYIDEATSTHLASGLAPRAARRAALHEVGGSLQAREQVRAYGWENVVDGLVFEVRLALRRLRASPSFALASIATLAVGIGGATAIFSAVRPILFDPLPYPDAARIRTIQELSPDGARNDGTFGMYRAFAERSRSFESVAVFRSWQPVLSGRGRAERLNGQRVTASFLPVLGVSPSFGRGFSESEDVADGAAVVILGDALWRRLFQADSSILGGTIRLDGVEHVVIGVMPARFENVLAPDAELWAPLQYDPAQGYAWGHHLRTIGRLAHGIAGEDGARELNDIARAVVAHDRPPTYSGDELWIAPALQADITRGVRPALFAVFGAVTLLLVLACANAANLLLARGLGRRAEFTLRLTLGSGRGRILRQLVAEGMVLAGAGGVTAIAVAHVGGGILVALAPPGLPRLAAIDLDAPTLLFAVLATTLIGMVFSLVPALQIGRDGWTGAPTGARHTAGRAQRRVQGTLVVAQVAIALILLAGSGLLLRSVQRLLDVPPGFEPADVATVQIHTAGALFTDRAAVLRFYEQVLNDVAQLPGVASAGLTSQLPLTGDFDSWGVHFESSPTQRVGEDRSAFRHAVSPGYIEAIGIPLRTGRLLDARDRAGAPPVALISESLARRRFPDGDVVGQRLRIGGNETLFTVVGVVGDVTQQSLALGASDAVYVSMEQWHFADAVVALVVRARGDVAPLAGVLRDVIQTANRDVAVARMTRLDALVASSAAERRFALIVFQAFALAALLLAATGLYGVIAGRTAERTRELGIRAALGATRGSVTVLVLAQGLRLTLAGIVIGLAAALLSSRAIEALLYGTSRLDVPTYAFVVTLLLVISLVACGIPALRAGRTDPATTLRAE